SYFPPHLGRTHWPSNLRHLPTWPEPPRDRHGHEILDSDVAALQN
uniref:Uncharacterized protein n=1 Tax=Aegilops tauschii subsp. strangulata TaxID=200361 RepID=A0A453LCB0_AEGTS